MSLAALTDYYNNDLWPLRDRRLDGWLMMDSIAPTLVASSAYVACATVVGPWFMRDRRPYDLKAVMQVYNLFQVVLSAYITWEAGVNGWFGHYNWICQDVERSHTSSDSTGMRMASVVWLYYLSKFAEFSDTFFFVARKKQGNVSALHVIHHGIMPVFGFALTRWLPGGQVGWVVGGPGMDSSCCCCCCCSSSAAVAVVAKQSVGTWQESFGGFLNSIVHVIMYSYYFLAALGPQFQRHLWWKKYLTLFQMIQFTAVFVKSWVVILGLSECGYPWQFSLLTSSIMVLFFVLFGNFYIQEYKRKAAAKKAANNNSNGVSSSSSSSSNGVSKKKE